MRCASDRSDLPAGITRRGTAKASNERFRRVVTPYQPYDLVNYNNHLYRVKGTHCKGQRVIISTHPKQKSVSVTKIERVTYGKGFQFLPSIPPPAKARGFP